MTLRDKYVKHFGVTDGDIRAIQDAAQAVWSYVGYDCLQAVAEEKGKSIDVVTMSRRDVIEIVMDAERLVDQLRPRKGTADYLSEKGRALVDAWWTLSRFDPECEKARKLMHILVRETFTYTRYGM